MGNIAHKIKSQPNCIWCGEPMSLTPNDPKQATREHLIPRSLGGWRLIHRAREHGFNIRKKNVALSCKACNTRRGNDLTFTTEHTQEPIQKLLEGVLAYLQGRGIERFTRLEMRRLKMDCLPNNPPPDSR